jgi:hypothetical protein
VAAGATARYAERGHDEDQCEQTSHGAEGSYLCPPA